MLQTSPFKIFVNQAGYEPGSRKRAVMNFPCETFSLIDASGVSHYEGRTVPFGMDENSGDDVYTADFSDFVEIGTYRIISGSERSAEFQIKANVYQKVFDDLTNAYYYLRCGCGLEKKYAGCYVHGRCHTGPAVLWESEIREIIESTKPDLKSFSALFENGNSEKIDVTGGWHDAGDYGRYVTAGSCAVAHLLYAYKLYPQIIKDHTMKIPESGSGMPDLLSECRIELEWLLKMQREDGGVYHKATTAMHADFVMPEEDLGQLYLLPVSSLAVADFAGVCALAAGIYAPFDKEFAAKLKDAAIKSCEWLEKNPEFLGFQNPEGCNTGVYDEDDDYSNRFWAYAELYALTGEEKYHKLLETALEKDFPLTELGYEEMGGLGSLACLLCSYPVDAALKERLKKAFLDEAERLKKVCDGCGYGCAMEEEDYKWGSNMVVLEYGMIFAICDYLTGPDYDTKACTVSKCDSLQQPASSQPCESGNVSGRDSLQQSSQPCESGDASAREAGAFSSKEYQEYAAAQLHYLLGVNAVGYSYVTGNGEFRCNHPHLRPAQVDGIEECIPGFVSGGPNRTLCDEMAAKLIPAGTKPMKCYADHVACYSLNEITIYWNSPAVFLVAYLKSKL